ncbi:23S rRNA (adenine(2030)-N(6))-methyltransferase RlmJ [Stenoxybacter acetivorans]|uniref:23S rRNA (adenine(2030)-N(6))-methyltransferase RlmJ n=1 Tax=Stenoxybacter acetivorans TaxID=422441 RepID=UPI00056B621A|nr:23S rRNA (adenine(2030)-N(6))-methyltransferase RlmJ [Stenoxybacter acetivorans]
MLSYRHAFHAGNHADVLKHFCLFAVLTYFNQKDKPYWYIDTHAGAGLYDLHDEKAQKIGEYQNGIARVLAHHGLPEDLTAFTSYLKQAVPDMNVHYCGSPWLAQALVRRDDRLRLFELHPTDYALLNQNMQESRAAKRTQIIHGDGFKGLLSLLPPPTRRAVVLIDPPYELKQDYSAAVQTLQAALKKFAGGCYLLWYPMLSRTESIGLPEKLKKLSPASYVHAQLQVNRPRADGLGMHGSGMFIINPPYTLVQILREVLPILTAVLAQDSGAVWHLDGKAV